VPISIKTTIRKPTVKIGIGIKLEYIIPVVPDSPANINQ